MKDRKKAPMGAAFTCASLLLFGFSCSTPPEPETFSGPVLLITMADMRADKVGVLGGEPGLTPALDSLADDAEWAIRAVSASSSPVPAMLSLATGTDPWQHGVLSHGIIDRATELQTLPQMMGEAGFATHFFGPATRDLGAFGPYEGFETATPITKGGRLIEESALRDHLAGLQPDGRTFTWVHMPTVSFPYQDRREELPSLAASRKSTVGRLELLQYADPNLEIPAELAQDAEHLYGHEIAAADAWLGRRLADLRRSGAFDDVLIVFTALHGTEFGEHGQSLFAQNLGRESIEVPLIVKFPQGKSRAIGNHQGPVETASLWSTLAEMVGGRVLPVHLPSLFRDSPSPALSSLFRHGPVNRFSIVSELEGGVFQLTLEVPFAEPEPEFFAAQLKEAGSKDIPMTTSPTRIHRRLDRSFRSAPPLLGTAPPMTKVEKWTDDGCRPVDDPELRHRLTEMLLQRRARFADPSRSPAWEKELRHLPEIVDSASDPGS